MTTQLSLTDEQLEHVCTVAETDWANAIVETFKLFGVDLTNDDCPQISPSDYTIPEHQWKAIAKCIGETSDTPITKTNNMMNWVNLGPSAY